MALWFRVNINFYCPLKNDIALGASASCNIIFLSAIKIDIALTQVPYLYNNGDNNNNITTTTNAIANLMMMMMTLRRIKEDNYGINNFQMLVLIHYH